MGLKAMDSQEIKIAMWREILHYVRCTKRSFLNIKIVITFLGLKNRVSRKGWMQVDRFLKKNGMKPDQHFCRAKRGRFRRGITFEAFVVLLYGAAELRDNNLTNRKEMKENIKWLQNHLLSLLRHSILIASAGIQLGDDSGFLHFDKIIHTTGGIGNNTPATSTSSTGELNQQGQPARSSRYNGIVTEQHGSVRHEMEASDNPERQNNHTAPRQDKTTTSSESKNHRKEPISMTLCTEMRSGMHNIKPFQITRKAQDNDRESDNFIMTPHVGNEIKSQLERRFLKSVNQKYRCKFCQRRFQRSRQGFLMFRRHVKNHEKRYFVRRQKFSGGPQKIPRKFKSEDSDALQPNEVSTNINSYHCGHVRRDTRPELTSSFMLQSSVYGEPSIVPTWTATGTRSVTDNVFPDLSTKRSASRNSASEVVDEYKVGTNDSCTDSVNKNSDVSCYDNGSTSMLNSLSAYSSEAYSSWSNLNQGGSAVTASNATFNHTLASTTGNTENKSVSQTAPSVIENKLNMTTSRNVTTCMNTTSQEISLSTHQKSSSERVPSVIRNRTSVHGCYLCHEKFSSKGSWKEHMEIHNKSQSYTCVIQRCGLVFHTKLSLEEHIQKQHKKQRWCDICCKTVNDFKTHMRIHTEKTCPYCPEKFNSQRKLRTHVTKHKRWCDICHKTVGKFKQHMRIHIDRSCPYCPEKFTRKIEFRKHVTKHERQCKYCDKTFQFTPARVEHELAVHENKVQYKCDICYMEFIHREDFNRHKRQTACIAKKCSFCDKIFQTASSLHNHEKHMHNGVPRRKTCVLCNKTFPDQDALILHRNTHTDDEKKLCKICGKGFLGSRRLYNHVLNVHSQQTFCCEVCGKNEHE